MPYVHKRSWMVPLSMHSVCMWFLPLRHRHRDRAWSLSGTLRTPFPLPVHLWCRIWSRLMWHPRFTSGRRCPMRKLWLPGLFTTPPYLAVVNPHQRHICRACHFCSSRIRPSSAACLLCLSAFSARLILLIFARLLEVWSEQQLNFHNLRPFVWRSCLVTCVRSLSLIVQEVCLEQSSVCEDSVGLSVEIIIIPRVPRFVQNEWCSLEVQTLSEQPWAILLDLALGADHRLLTEVQGADLVVDVSVVEKEIGSVSVIAGVDIILTRVQEVALHDEGVDLLLTALPQSAWIASVEALPVEIVAGLL